MTVFGHIGSERSGSIESEARGRAGQACVEDAILIRSEMRTPCERELVEAARRGSILAFESLVCRYQAKIFRTAQKISRQREDAEDITQSAFLKAFKKLAQFRGETGFAHGSLA